MVDPRRPLLNPTLTLHAFKCIIFGGVEEVVSS